MKLFVIKDSRGRESTTLMFVTLSWLVVTGIFLWKGSAADILNYGTAVAAILAIWLGREWQARPKGDENGTEG